MNSYYSILLLALISMQTIYAQTTVPKTTPAPKGAINTKELRTGGYSLINPLLDCYDIKSSSLFSNKQLEYKISEFIKKAKTEKKIESASVYYRDLNNGPWIGINEEALYAPASLLKVPYLLAVLYQAQSDTSFLSKRVTCYKNSSYYNQSITDGFKIEYGNSYTIDELLSAMIIHSDNIAKDMLMENISNESYFEIFNELGIDIAKYDTTKISADFLSVKEYASFFRILYNSTFLNKKMSEKALSLLTNTTFRSGIVAGIPDDVKVAHKFGERFFYNIELKQLHDCGIIYKYKMPYILCVMTKGTDHNKMSSVISEISKIVYTHLNKSPGI